MLEVKQIGPNATFVQNTDVKQCEAIVFAEAVRTGRTMLDVIDHVLNVDDSNTELLCACETVQEQIVNTYKKQIIFDFLDDLHYKYDPTK